MAMNLFGHGIALSGDFIIQGAPKLTADAAGLPVTDVIQASIPLVLVMGLVTTITAFIFLKRDMKKGLLIAESTVVSESTFDKHFSKKELVHLKTLLTPQAKKFIAFLIPLLFLLDVAAMFLLNLSGGDATALVGGTAVFILILISLMAHKNSGFEETTSYLIEGFQFGFKVFGPVIPIAAFFYLGDLGFNTIIGEFLPEQ